MRRCGSAATNRRQAIKGWVCPSKFQGLVHLLIRRRKCPKRNKMSSEKCETCSHERCDKCKLATLGSKCWATMGICEGARRFKGMYELATKLKRTSINGNMGRRWWRSAKHMICICIHRSTFHQWATHASTEYFIIITIITSSFFKVSTLHSRSHEKLFSYVVLWLEIGFSH